MRHHRFARLALLAFTCGVAILLVACQSPAAAPKLAAVDKSNWPKTVTVAAAVQGGPNYLWAAAFSKLISEKVGIPANVEAGTGATAQIELVNRKESDFGATTVPAVWEGYGGMGWAKNKQPLKDVRSIIPMYSAYLHWWALASSGIKTVYDFSGKIVNLSGATSSPNIYGPLLFNLLGVKPQRVTNLGSFGDVTAQFKDGRIHAAAAWGGVPHPAAEELALTQPLNIIGVPKEAAEHFVKEHPSIGVATIPANTYKGQIEALTTLSILNVAITHKDAPEGFVYEVTKATMENRDVLVAVYKGASETTLENVQWITTPLHVGALRYYREKGVKIAESAIPPEGK